MPLDDAAVLDAPEIDLGNETEVDLGTETQDTGDDHTPEGADSAADTSKDDGPAGADKSGRLVGQDGKLSASIKPLLDKLKTGTPEEQKAAKLITRAAFAEDRLRRELPGGFGELKQLRQQVEDLGGFEGWKERGAELEHFNNLDQQYTNADPKFVEALLASDIGKNAFLRLMPTMLSKFGELNAEGHSAYLAQQIVGDMMASRLPVAIEMLGALIKDNPQATEYWKQIAEYVNRLNGFAQKPIAPAAQARSNEPDQRQQELDQREQQLRHTEWTNEAKGQHQTIYRQAFSRILGDRKLSDVQKENVATFYEKELAKLLPADFKNKAEQYFRNQQKDGYLRYRSGVLTDAVPKALRKALERAGVGQKPGPKGGQQQQQQQQRQASQKPDQGFTFVNQKPDFSKVDNRLTTPSMYTQGKAILKDGTRVQWKR